MLHQGHTVAIDETLVARRKPGNARGRAVPPQWMLPTQCAAASIQWADATTHRRRSTSSTRICAADASTRCRLHHEAWLGPEEAGGRQAALPLPTAVNVVQPDDRVFELLDVVPRGLRVSQRRLVSCGERVPSAALGPSPRRRPPSTTLPCRSRRRVAQPGPRRNQGPYA